MLCGCFGDETNDGAKGNHESKTLSGPPEDNNPQHEGRATITWFRSETVNVLQWPSKSPALNLVQSLFRRPGNCFFSRNYFTKKKSSVSSNGQLIATNPKRICDCSNSLLYKPGNNGDEYKGIKICNLGVLLVKVNLSFHFKMIQYFNLQFVRV